MTMGANMANRNKNSKEPIYRTPDGVRWRYLKTAVGGFEGCWLMARIKDGHRLYVKIERLELEKPNDD